MQHPVLASVSRDFRRHFAHFLSLQVPVLLLEPLSIIFGVRSTPEVHYAVIAITLVLSGFATAAVFVSVSTIARGNHPAFLASYGAIFQRAGTLLLGSLFVHSILILILVALNLIALVFPAPFFLTFYIFAPMIIMENKEGILVCLNRSTQLARSRFWPTFAIVFAILIGGTVLEFAGEMFGTKLESVFGPEIGLAFGKFVLGIVGVTLIDIAVSHYYIQTKLRRENS